MKLSPLLFAMTACLLLPIPTFAQNSSSPSTADEATALTVQVASPRITKWPVTINASGVLRAWQEAVVASETGGQRITGIHADVGSEVSKGEVLVELAQDSLKNDIMQLEASLESAQAALEQAAVDADRARRLTGTGSISQQQIAEYLTTERKAKADVVLAEAKLASAHLDLEHSRIVAVDDGIISSRSAALGNVVSSGTELFRLIRQGRIEWQAEVSLRHLRNISVGADAVIPTPLGDVTGEVRQIAPTASETNGRIKVYVALDAPEGGLVPQTGILASGYFLLGQSEAVTVPASAILLRDGFSYVYVLGTDDPIRVTRMRVETGRRQDNRVEVTSYFPPESQIVQSGTSFLSEGSLVNVVESNLAADASVLVSEVAE